MAQVKKSPKAPAKARKAPSNPTAKKRRKEATTRVYAKKFRQDPRAAFQSMVQCLSQGELESLKQNLRSQYESLQAVLAEKQAAFTEKQAKLLEPWRALQAIFARD